MTKTRGVYEWADHTANFQKGCENACVYCYANAMAFKFKRIDQPADWGKDPVINMKEVNKKFRKRVGRTMFPTTHDLTIRNMYLAGVHLTNMLKAGNEVLITTKPNYAVVDYLCKHLIHYRNQILWRFTITSFDHEISRLYEPNAPLPDERLGTLIHAFKEDYRTSVSIEPFLDIDPTVLIFLVQDSVTDTIWIGPMNRRHLVVLGRDDLWRDDLWGRDALIKLKAKLDKEDLAYDKLRLKDGFLNAIR